MPAKKKTKKKTAKLKKRVRTTAKSAAAKRKAPAKKKALKKKPAKKRAPKNVRAKASPRRQTRGQVENTYSPPARAGSGRQSGDLQGLTRRRIADSESVEELLEEGNTLEAGVVSGVEEAEDDEPREVHTHEVPVDDVPEEYLDKD